jgi:Tfp pilus assembly protein PilO
VSIKDLLAYVEAKMLLLLGLAIVGLTLTASYLYLFKEPSVVFFKWHEELEKLQNKRSSVLSLDVGIQNLRNELVKLNGATKPSFPRTSLSQTIATVIGQLDQIAEQHSVTLLGIRPGTYTPVYVFDEMPFLVEVMGTYSNLFNWVYEIETRLESLVVKRFEIEPISEQQERRMRLTIVLYHPREQIR